MAREGSTVPCPLCRSPEVAGRLSLRGKTYLVCKRCHTHRLFPRPEPEETTRFYEQDYGRHFLARGESPGRRAMLESLLRRLGPAGGRRLLDIGAATGLLVKLAREMGWDAQGMELSEHGRELARSQHGIDLLDPRSHRPDEAAYDVVSVVNVLDQAAEPARLLREAVRVLRPGGRVVLRLPNADLVKLWLGVTSTLRLNRAERSVVLHDFLFPRKSLARVLPLFGIEPVRVRPSRPAGGKLEGSFHRLAAILASRALARPVAWLSGDRLLCSFSIEITAERVFEPWSRARAREAQRPFL